MEQESTRFRVTVTTRGAMLLLVLGVGAVFLWTVRSVLTPMIWGLIVAYLFAPAIRFAEHRIHLPRLLVVILLVASFVGLIIWVFLTTVPVLTQELRELTTALPRIVDQVQDFLLGTETIYVLGFTIDPSSYTSEVEGAIRNSMTIIGRQAVPFVVRAFGSVVQIFLFLISTFYLALDIERIGPAVVNFMPRRWRRDVIPLFVDMESILGRYMRGQALLILIQISASWVVLSALQIRYALLLAIVTGVVEIFPVIGPWTAGAIAVSVALTQQTTLFGGNSVYLAIAVAVAYLIIRQVEDVVVIPNLVGKVMELHPLLVLFALTAGSHLAGILGLLVAVPITAVIKRFLMFLREKMIEEDRAIGAELRSKPPSAGPTPG
jgi:predicted PurR-regulated permease PerM